MKKSIRILAILLIASIISTSIPIEGMAAQSESVIANAEQEIPETFSETGEIENVAIQDEESMLANAKLKDGVEEETPEDEKDNVQLKDSIVTEKEDSGNDKASTEERVSEEHLKIIEGIENNETENRIDVVRALEEEVITDNQANFVIEKITDIEKVEQTTEEAYLIEYLVVNQSSLTLGEKQQIVLGVDCEKEIETATLSYYNQATGEVFQQSFSEAIEDTLLFEILFGDISQTGTYQLENITFTVDGNKYVENFSKTGIEAVFGMNQEIRIESDAVIVDDIVDEFDTEIDIVRIDENGNTVSELSLEDAIENVNEGQSAFYARQKASDIVVVLDPGHDNTHAGAQANALGEEDLNLKIAEYCKTELETYLGVYVYLTRELDGECPYPGTSSGQCNKKRVEFAQSVGADIYVSLHNNAAENPSAHGAMVFYPNSNYNSAVSEQGEALAQKIQEQLVALGLYDRGITVKDSADFKYSDGSIADYYSVIRDSKKVGIAAVIVEHAFVSNIDDVNAFLSSDEKLKTLGVSDAIAIAACYGLVKEVNVTVDSVQVSISNNDKGLATIKAINVAPSDKIEKLSFAVWSDANQNNLHRYNVVNNGSGNYEATLDISKHNYKYENYTIHTYAYDIYGKKHYIGGKTCNFLKPSIKVSIDDSITQMNYIVTTSGVAVNKEFHSINVAVWSNKNGQDDLKWYKATEDSNGAYKASVPITNHKTAGKYTVHVYMTRINGTKTCVGTSTFEVTPPSAEKIEIDNQSNESGTFDVIVNGVQSVSGVSKVQIPVWSKSDQSDLHWYTGKKQSDGSYIANINLANHKYNYGKYNIDAYVNTINGIRLCVGNTSVVLSMPKSSIQALKNVTETQCELTATNVWPQESVKKVEFAVWSQNRGQDDLVRYTASQNMSGVYEVSVPIVNHKTAGKYTVHVYMIAVNGTKTYVGTTTFEVTAPSAEKIAIENQSDEKGTFDVVITDVQAVSGVSKVQVPVWSKPDQSDLYWYTAKKQQDGSYIANVNLANHKYNFGKYNTDVYVTTENGIRQCIGGTNVTMVIPMAKTIAVANAVQTSYMLTATNVWVPGGVHSLKFAVWSAKKGQDDLVWYTANKSGDGEWSVNVQISNHKTEGNYFVDTYAVKLSGEKVYLSGTMFTVESPAVSAVRLINYNEAFGNFGVEIAGVESTAGIENVKVAVWSAVNQSDLLWYDATLTSKDTYQIAVDIQKHQNNKGTYYADTYITMKNGIKVYVGGITCSIVNVTKSIGKISSCEIVEGSKSEITINLNLELTNAIRNFDKYYIVETDLYDGNIERILDTREVDVKTNSINVTISGKDMVKAVAMDGVALAVKDNKGNLVLASESIVISNPEAIASNADVIFKGSSKKGLQGIYYATYDGGDDILEARNANTKQTLINLDLASVVTTNSNKAGYKPYTYKGNTYYFSELSALKANVRSLNIGYKQYLNGNNGTTPVAVTLCLLLSYNSENSFLIDPAARTPGRAYYTLNVREEYARETLEALFFYLGETFGQSDCYVSNWILGNEINSSKAWNYSGSLDFDTYMDCYATAFRMLYTGVKSEKTGNTVSISLDNGWTAAPDTYAGKTTLDTFAKKIHAQNPNIEWSIAYHPYSYPLTRVDFWNDYKNTTDSLSTPYISMRNINVLTDYAGTLESTYGKKAGSIRVLLTEQGYSYSGGAENQAMAIARGYYIAEFNDRIDAFIIRAVVDDADEASGKLYFGLMNSQHEKRIAFYVYEFMDSSRSGFASQSSSIVSDENRSKFEAAKSIVCNTNWSSIVPGFDDSKLAAIK